MSDSKHKLEVFWKKKKFLLSGNYWSSIRKKFTKKVDYSLWGGHYDFFQILVALYRSAVPIFGSFFSLPFMHTYKDVYFVACRDPFEIDLSFGVTFFQIPWFGQNDVYTFDPALASCKFKKSTPTVI